jgi:hypothetical protein
MVIALLGCGTTHNYTLHRPLKKGEAETWVGLNYSFCKFIPVSVQAGVFFGVSDNDVLGVTVTNFPFLLHSVNYAHFKEHNNDHISFHLIFDNLLGIHYDPPIKALIGYNRVDGRFSHSFRVGAGIALTPLGTLLTKVKYHDPRLVWLSNYSFIFKKYQLNLKHQTGYARYYINHVKSGPEPREGDGGEIRIPKNRIKQIETGDDIRLEYNQYVCKVHLERDTILAISERDPYGDCWGCRYQRSDRNGYTASKYHQVYWVYYAWRDKDWLDPPVLMELDLSDIMNRYEETDTLVIKEDPDVRENSLQNMTPYISDFSISAGYRTD